MKYALTGSQMKQYDDYVISKIGIESAVLMENAARTAMEVLLKRYRRKTCFAIVCGSGNNGADGLALYRLLYEKGIRVTCYLLDSAHWSPQFLQQKAILEALRLPVTVIEAEEQLMQWDADVLVDAIFGVGINRDVTGLAAAAIQSMNRSGKRICSLDLPSGIHADNGRICGIAIEADATVTFGYRKTGMFFYPGKMHCGKIYCTDIGYPNRCEEMPKNICYLTSKDKKRLKRCFATANKGSFGKVLIVAGSKAYSGAALLATRAAYSMGAGMVKTVTHRDNKEMLAVAIPEALHMSYEEHDFPWQGLQESIRWADVIVVGPGLSCDKMAEKILESILKEHGEKPLILDADALNLLAMHADWCSYLNQKTILTPHCKEMERLSGLPVEKIKQEPLAIARAYAKEHSCILVLKDAVTVTTDGRVAFLNTSGNEGMATAGSGDVLAGMLGCMSAECEGASLLQMVAMGVYIHGKAGDTAAKMYGKRAMLAGNLIDGLKKMKL